MNHRLRTPGGPAGIMSCTLLHFTGREAEGQAGATAPKSHSQLRLVPASSNLQSGGLKPCRSYRVGRPGEQGAERGSMALSPEPLALEGLGTQVASELTLIGLLGFTI